MDRKAQAAPRRFAGVDLALLRDKTYMTELCILFALHRDPQAGLTGVAEQLDVTVQAVSNHAKRMADDGLLKTDPHRVTPQGVQALHSRIEEVKRAVDGAYERLNVVTETTALAGEAVAEGETVGLVMEDGLLVAYPGRDSSSVGVAGADARQGETVPVTDLEGILDIRSGEIHLVRLPAEGSDADLEALLDEEDLAFDRVAGLGTEATVRARRLDAPVLEFAPVEASFEAAQLGLDVLLLATPERVRDAVATLEGRNEDALIPVRYRLLEATSR